MAPKGKREEQKGEIGTKLGAKTKLNLLNEEEIKRILDKCEEDQKPVIYTLAYTGMRVSELIHMQKDWIDWEAGLIRIPESQLCESKHHPECMRAKKIKGKIIKQSGLWRVKVPEAARGIPILPELRPILESFFKGHGSMGEVVKRRENVWRMVRYVKDKAGIQKRIFPHVLRGSLASLLAGKDFDALSIQGFMGWKSVKTADEYVRISPERLKRIVEKKW
jgi:integrase/recombinase XerD